MSEPAPEPLHVERVPVRWGDMDSLGHVNNAAYFTYCETARMGLFDRLRLADYAGDMGPVVATASCTFRQQLKYPATLAVEVGCARIGRSSFTLTYALRRLTDGGEPEPEPVCTGESVVVWIDFAQGSSVPLPEAMRQALGG
ncbi:MAG: acyl-CoA thioesterase [Planctomycetota bacterium]